jgi:hypothetical protein
MHVVSVLGSCAPVHRLSPNAEQPVALPTRLSCCKAITPKFQVSENLSKQRNWVKYNVGSTCLHLQGTNSKQTLISTQKDILFFLLITERKLSFKDYDQRKATLLNF